MTDVTLDCLGSVILFNEKNRYCSNCLFKEQCSEVVQKNKAAIEEAFGRPLYGAGGKFWERAAVTSRKRKTLAVKLSTPTLITPDKPKAAKPVIKAPANKLAPVDAMETEGLPKKVYDQLAKWIRNGIDPSVIERCENPFEHKTNFKIEGQFAEAYLSLFEKPTKRELKDAMVALQTHTGKVWTDSSLQSNINLVSGAFKACGYLLFKE